MIEVMKKKFWFSALALAAMMLASCASSDDGLKTEQKSPTELTPADGQFPVSFGAYADRGTTRGGMTGAMDLTALRSATGAFGVFAYYTDLKKYDQTYLPNFMYNMKVYDANEGAGDASWTYTPAMYWPNESGTDASSDDEDKVSFFAYAPYVLSTAAGNVEDATYGITGFSRNSNAGDPLVKYIANFSTANTVDLCWGVCNEPNWAKIQSGNTQTMTLGLPWLDVEHPQTTSQKMNFTFKHALAQLNVQIDADADVTAHAAGAGADTLGTGTKIYVRSISFTGIAMKGALNLNNTTANQALWLDYSGTTDLPYGESVTVKDGRRDGREGSSGAEATNETPAGLNPAIIQNDANNPTIGVTTQYQNLFAPAVAAAIPGQPTTQEIATALTNPVYVIPTGEAMTVTIVYDVETANPDLTSYLSDGVTHGTSIENKITKTIYLNGDGMSLECGNKYTLCLHLGMNSLKFDAAVGHWEEWEGGYWIGSQLPGNLSAVRILKEGVQVSKVPVALSDATLALTGDVNIAGADQTLVWTSSAPAVASFDDSSVGTLTLNTEGTCTITATSTATGKSATCDILVTHNYANVVAPSGTVGDPGYDFGDVRKIIAADGLIYTNTTQAKEWGTNGVGVICYVGAAGSVDKDASAASYKALALALTDANDGAYCRWHDNNNVTCLPQQIIDDGTYTFDFYATEGAYQSGIANTATLIADGHTHAAATGAHNYDVDVSGFINSGWFLPSISQWNMMIKTLAPTTESDAVMPNSIEYPNRVHNNSDIPDNTYYNPGYSASTLNPHFTAVGAAGLQNFLYWSSSEGSANGAWAVWFEKGCITGTGKKNHRYIRAALAF